MKRTSIFVILLLSLIACTDNFEKINTNPNYPDNAPLINVFCYVTEEISSLFGEQEMKYPAAFAGYLSKGTYIDVTNYLMSPKETTWSTIYTDILTNANYVISGAKDEGNKNLEAAAMILKAYALQMAVDIYGKVPYFEAGKATTGVIHPHYNEEKEIYYDLLNSLKTANDLFDVSNGGTIGEGDLLFGGEVGKWKKFGNSLRLRMAIRISYSDEAKSKEVIAEILNDPAGNPILESNDDNAFVSYSGGDWVEPWTTENNYTVDGFIAKPIIDTLLRYSDPRIAFYAEPLENGQYRGLEVGSDADTAYSRVNDRFVNNPTGKIWLMKYSETMFIVTEAIMRGFVTGDAAEAYQKAVTASLKEYEITDAAVSAYLSNPNVAWKNELKQLYVQKWIALFRQSWEAWAEMRRTDVPTLPPASHSAYSGHTRTPFRFPYPDSEKKLNSVNIPAQVTEDDYFWGYQVWWDTRKEVK
jgi:hypothetical protein